MKQALHPLRALFIASNAGLVSHTGWADAPLDPVWVDVRITTCASQMFKAPWFALFDDRYTFGETFKTTYVTGLAQRSGTLKNLERPASRPQPGERIELSAPDLPPGFCQDAVGKIKRFTYTYTCDTLERKGRCLPPAPDAILIDE